MTRTCTFFIGPAGVGKSTLINKLAEIHKFQPINLDPSTFSDLFSLDMREYINIDELMETHDIGPNNALLKAFDCLMNDTEIKRDFSNELETLTNFDLLVDCPGQLEIYLHSNSFKSLVTELFSKKYRILILFALDSTGDERKFMASSISSALISSRLCFPYVNILTKCDLKKITFSNTEVRGDKDFIDKNIVINDDGYINRLGDINIEKLDSLGKILYDFLISYGPDYLPVSINDEDLLLRLKNEIHNCVNLDEE